MKNTTTEEKKPTAKPTTHPTEHNGMEESVLTRNLPTAKPVMSYHHTTGKNEDYKRLIGLPEWLFPTVCDRKDQSKLTVTEQQRIICAFNMINNDGTLGKLVDIHEEMHMQHTDDRLLPWHRVFIYLFEEALHQYHPDVCLPYWDWTKPAGQNIPVWLAGVTPVVQTPTRTLTVSRAPGSSASLASIASGVATANSQTTYSSFGSLVNGIHGSVHMWVGGTMSDITESPADILFWMHHANLDRLWWKWYNSPQGQGKNPPLTGADAVMDPWAFTETQIRQISTLHYQYV